MELTNLPPILPSNTTSSLLGKALASFGSEVDQLIEMTENKKLPVSNLGANVDIKA